MKFSAPLIVVSDIHKSRSFYEEVMRQKVKLDFGENIVFDGDFSLQSKESWMRFIKKREEDILSWNNSFELFFEEEDIEEFLLHLRSFKSIELLHELKEYPWGQRVIRFYDPDHHIIEVGESMKPVIKRFLETGMSIQEASERSQFPIEYVMSCIN